MTRRRPHRGAWTRQERDARGRVQPVDAMRRFIEKCRFEPETGCVVWTGGTTMGRGHHAPYPAFWFEGRRWFGHRWAAKFIHGLDIDNLQVDHCCPNRAKPNTLCVEHLQAITLRENRALLDLRRQMIHLQVGLLSYHDVYGHDLEPEEVISIPYFDPPAWFVAGQPGASNDCPF